MAINPAILAAMKAKSAAIQASRSPNVGNSEIQKFEPAPKSNYEPAILPSLTIDIDQSQKLLIATFDSQPTPGQRETLLSIGFDWHHGLIYHAKDTGKVRASLSREFGADFGEEPIPVETPSKELVFAGSVDAQSVTPSAPNYVPPEYTKGKARLDIVVADDLDDEPNEVSKLSGFELFRRQTDELLEHFEMVRPGTRPADLMLIAIDALHKSTLGRN